VITTAITVRFGKLCASGGESPPRLAEKKQTVGIHS